MMRVLRNKKRGAFSLLELLAVVGIIGLLSALVLAASLAVAKKQRRNATQNMLFKLDQILEEYVAQRNTIPGFVPEAYVDVPVSPRPLSTYRGEQYPARPDASVFIRQVQGVGECDTLIASIPESYLIQTETDEVPSVVDSWATWPEDERGIVYYVHPDNVLAQAVLGRCINRRPYFVSAGPDGLFGHPFEFAVYGLHSGTDEEDNESLKGFRADNVYSYEGIELDFDISSDAFSAAE